MKQEVNQKRRKLCQTIINQDRPEPRRVTVRAAFMNGQLPHGVCLAWTGPKDAYLVNLKKKTAREYVRDGKFMMKRALLPVRVRVDIPTYDLSYLETKDGVQIFGDTDVKF